MIRNSRMRPTASHLRILLLCLAIFAGTTMAFPQACFYVKNVELSQFPESGKSARIEYNFKNTNAYKVTVDATFILANDKGETKRQTRTIVLEPGEQRKVTFSASGIFDGGFLSVTDSSATFAVWKCD